APLQPVPHTGTEFHYVDPPGETRTARSGPRLRALPGRELVAGLGAFDHAADEPAAPDRERREHELADLALDSGRRRIPVVGLLLRQPPDRRHGDPLPGRVCPYRPVRGKFGSRPPG